MRALLFLFVAVFILFPGTLQAARFSGSYLLHVCGSDPAGQELVPGGHIACQAYIAGILDYHNLIHSLGTSPSVDFCVPEDVELSVLQKKIVAYLIKNKAEHEHFVASPGVALALYSEYPCKK